MELVSITNLTKRFGETVALDNLNMTLTSGKVIGLLGPNGSGKTTLIKLLAGLLLQHSGSILINGKEIGPETKAVVSYLPDKNYFEKWMRIKDLREYFKDFYLDFNENRFAELITKFKLDSKNKIGSFSKGNQEKLQLALVLSRDAMIYLFDEPIGGVDPALRTLILETIESYKNTNSLVILSTHQIYDTEELFDEVIFLKEGKLYTHENTKELVLKHQKSLLEVFKEVFKYDN